MRYANCHKVLTTLLFVLSAIPSGMAAEELPPCGAFTLHGGKFDVTAVDVGEKGDSIGDERIGERELMDANGSVIGTFRWVSHVVDTDEGSGELDIALNQNVYSLPEGTIHGDGQFVFKTAMDEKSQPLKRNMVAVIGGTGAYVRSHGQIVATFEPGKPSTYEFQLYCD